jgi:glucokinase
MIALITVDIGGTSMRAAAYSINTNKPLMHQKIPTTGSNQSVYDRLVDLIHSIWQDNFEVAAIVVASAGPLDPKTGYIFDAPNIPGWKNFPLGEKLAKEFPIPIFIGNDANLAALGEWKYGCGSGHHDLIYLTISTGIGGGIICNNQLVEGSNGLAAELGHITVLPDGPTCSCGKQGHLEAISSGKAIVEYIHQMITNGERSVLAGSKDLSAFDVATAARTGDRLAIQAYSRAGFYLGQALASFIHMLNPSIIILGGGVSQSGPLLFDPILKKLQLEIMDPSYLKELKILPTALGDDAGLLGALALGRQKLNLI